MFKLNKVNKVNIRLLERSTSRYIDALYAVLLTSEDDFLFFPEFYEIFGRNSVIKFFEIFAGQTIKVPSLSKLETKIRDVTIFCQYKTDPTCKLRLIEDYHLRETELDAIISRVESSFSKLGIEISEV